MHPFGYEFLQRISKAAPPFRRIFGVCVLTFGAGRFFKRNSARPTPQSRTSERSSDSFERLARQLCVGFFIFWETLNSFKSKFPGQRQNVRIRTAEGRICCPNNIITLCSCNRQLQKGRMRYIKPYSNPLDFFARKWYENRNSLFLMLYFRMKTVYNIIVAGAGERNYNGKNQCRNKNCERRRHCR